MAISKEKICQYADIIRQFLKNSHDKNASDNFFELSYQHTVGSIYHLQRLGYHIKRKSDNMSSDISDLAFDLLGYFLAYENRRQYGIIFDYYERHKISLEDESNDIEIYHHFSILMRGFIKKRIPKLANEEDPQKANLKRRIDDILKHEDFARNNPGTKELIYLRKNADNLRLDKELIGYDQVEKITIQAFNDTNTRVQWCRAIFDLLNKYDEFQNRIPRHLLLTAIIAVNSHHAEFDSWQTIFILSPDDDLVRKSINESIEKAINLLKEKDLLEFVRKGRITDSEVNLFAVVIKNYLDDFVGQHGCDMIPQYFYEVMPEGKHSSYLSDYKYVFETVISKAKEYFEGFIEK